MLCAAVGVNSRTRGLLIKNSQISKPMGTPTDACAPSALQVGIAAAAAPHESATTTAEVQTGLLELNKETFDDYISAAGDVLVVVDFFTEASLLASVACSGVFIDT